MNMTLKYNTCHKTSLNCARHCCVLCVNYLNSSLQRPWRYSLSSSIDECSVIPQKQIFRFQRLNTELSPQHSPMWVGWLSCVSLLQRVAQRSILPSTPALQKRRKWAEDLGADLRGHVRKFPIPSDRTGRKSYSQNLSQASLQLQVGWVNIEKHVEFSLIFHEQRIDSARETDAQRSEVTHQVTKLINNIAQIPIQDNLRSVCLSP